jgi:hypothetical protein
VHAILALANPDMPICDGIGLLASCAKGLNFALLVRDPTISGISQILHDDFKSSILFLYGEFSASPPSSCANEAKVLSLLSFSNSDSFRDFPNALPVLNLQPLPTVLEVFQVLCTHSHNNPGLSLLRLTTETSIQPALYLHGSNNPTPLWSMRIRASLLNLLNALYAEEFDCTLCRNLLARTVK